MTSKMPLVNGYAYSFASVQISVAGQKITLIKSINYSQEKKPGEIRGNYSQKMARTRGDLNDTGDLELYLAEADALLKALGNGYMDKPFDVVVSYAEDGQPTITDKLFGCLITKVDRNNSQSTDGTTVKFELDIMHAKYSGLDPIKNMR